MENCVLLHHKSNLHKDEINSLLKAGNGFALLEHRATNRTYGLDHASFGHYISGQLSH